MAITLLQQPTSPNGSGGDIIYVVSSNETAQPQHKFLLDVKDGNDVLLKRLKQPTNPSGYCVFEISQIIDDYMGYDEVWNTTTITSSSKSNIKDFKIYAGEEYGASISGSVTIYNGNGGVGDPAVGGGTKTFIPAVEERSEGFNWVFSDYTASYLTNSPLTQSVSTDEWGTLTHFNITGSNPTTITYTVRDSNNTILGTTSLTNTFSTSVESSKIIHIPVGPKNLSSLPTIGSILQGQTWNTLQVVSNTNLGTITYKRRDNCIPQNGTRFAFINKLGVWDYYTGTLTKTQTRSFNTNTYQQNFIDYSTNTPTITFNPSRRGETIYNKTIDAVFSSQTDWLTQSEADWLVELFESPSVLIQSDNYFLPVVITNQNIDMKTNPRGQKLFTYTIEYRLANKKKNRK